MKKIFTKRLIALFAVAAVTFSSLGNFGAISFAEETTTQPVDEVVMQTVSEDRAGFSMTVSGAAQGSGAQITQEPVAFNYNYLALRLISTYVVNANGDTYFPVQLYVNGNLVQGPEDYIALPTYNADGTKAEAQIETKWGGYTFVTPDFDGYIYIPASVLNIKELTSLKVAFDGAHDGELVIADIFGCKNEGERLGAPVINEGNLIAEGQGVTIKDGFELSYVADGTNFGQLKATFDEIAFNSEYLAVDLTIDKAVNINAASDQYAVFELYVNNTVTGTIDVDSISVYCRSNSEITAVENKWNNWFFIPAGFDGILYISKTLIGTPTAISQLSLRFENVHSVEMTINSVFGCDQVGSDFTLHTGTMFTTSVNTNTINATTVENTVAGITTATVTTTNTLAMTNDDYVAVYVKMLSSNYPYGGPSESDPNTYIRFSVNGILLPEKGEITTHKPTDGSEGVAIAHQWGNWVFVPYGYDGIFYFSVKDYLPGQTSLSSFTFTFNETHLQKMEYKVGVATEVGGTPTWLDFVTGGTAETVKEILNLSQFKAESSDIAIVMPTIGYTAENNIITDEKVTADSGITVFDTYSYSFVKFGGIYLPEEWENQLVISVKTAFEGGSAITADDADEDFGYMELNLGENAFDMTSGLALNVLCLSPECYFKVLVIDENGAVWIADHERTDYTCVADRVPVGMSTQFNNFFYGEGSYGTLYIQKEWFSLTDRYNGELLNQTATEMGKITKIVIGMDHLWGLGRSMCVGRMANVDLQNKVFTTVFNPATMTDEQIGAGASGGTLVSCPGSEAHVNNFALRRLLLVETPGYEEPDTPVVPDDSSSSEPDSSSASTSVPTQSGTDTTESKSCSSSIGMMSSVLSLAVIALTVGVIKGKKEN